MDEKAILELKNWAKQLGISKCTNCGNLVEKSNGCNHMRCRCKYQFCYICSRKYPCGGGEGCQKNMNF